MSKATEALANLQGKNQNRAEFDPSLLKVLWESDPVEVSARHGVISVQVYSYNNGEPKIGVYRVGVDTRENKVFHSKQLCPLNPVQALTLAQRLSEASKVLEQLAKK
jgi:hypothetical protein